MGTLPSVERETQRRGLHGFYLFKSVSEVIFDRAHVLLGYLLSRRKCSWKQLVTYELSLEPEASPDYAFSSNAAALA